MPNVIEVTDEMKGRIARALMALTISVSVDDPNVGSETARSAMHMMALLLELVGVDFNDAWKAAQASDIAREFYLAVDERGFYFSENDAQPFVDRYVEVLFG